MTFPELYPHGNQRHLDSLGAVGPFTGARPSGVTLHYTADRDLDRVLAALRLRSLAYHILIDRDGTVYQTVRLTKAVWHAGKALWGQVSPNRMHLGVAFISWGEVEKDGAAFKTWNDKIVPAQDVAYRAGEHWDAATPVQEAAAIAFLVWACSEGIDPAAICGHDECALPHGRKIDPGGVISMSMEALRADVRRRLAGV